MDVLILSTWTDTNGQNARYARAAEKWGRGKAVRKILVLGNTDPAGVVGRFQDAAQELDEGLSIRSAHRAVPYMDFPGDILWNRDTDKQVRRLAQQADLIHLNNSYRSYLTLGLKGKPALIHHHGSLFRKDPEHMLAMARMYGMVSAVSTVDLMEPAPDKLHWLPTAYDMTELAAIRKANKRKPDGRIRVVSCPTNPIYKSTEALIGAISTLQAEGLPIDLVIVENQRWQEAMKVKAMADIVFDQVMFGYGCNGVEAWGMGLPVIAGGQPWTLNKMREMWGGLPFYVATEQTIAKAIRALALSADLRAEYAAKGLAHVRKYHAEKPALERLAELYALALKQKATGTYKLEQPVTFVNPQSRAIFDQGRRLAWEDGLLRTDDPDLAARLKRFEERRPRWGIREVAV